MVKDHSDSERGNTLPLLLGIFYMHYPTDRIAHTTALAFVTPVVEREISQWVHHEGSIRGRSFHGATSRTIRAHE